MFVWLERRFSSFFGANANHVVYRDNENFAVAEFPGVGRSQERIDDEIFDIIRNSHFDLYLRDEFDLILGASIRLGVSTLATVALNFADGHAVHVDFLERSSNGIQQMWPDNRFDFFHLSLSLTSFAAWSSP